jgi:hypothetical protein
MRRGRRGVAALATACIVLYNVSIAVLRTSSARRATAASPARTGRFTRGRRALSASIAALNPIADTLNTMQTTEQRSSGPKGLRAPVPPGTASWVPMRPGCVVRNPNGCLYMAAKVEGGLKTKRRDGSATERLPSSVGRTPGNHTDIGARFAARVPISRMNAASYRTVHDQERTVRELRLWPRVVGRRQQSRLRRPPEAPYTVVGQGRWVSHSSIKASCSPGGQPGGLRVAWPCVRAPTGPIAVALALGWVLRQTTLLWSLMRDELACLHGAASWSRSHGQARPQDAAFDHFDDGTGGAGGCRLRRLHSLTCGVVGRRLVALV